MKKKNKKANKNIVESVRFLSEDDMLVEELDKRLSYSAVVSPSSNKEWCLCVKYCDCHGFTAVAGVRG